MKKIKKEIIKNLIKDLGELKKTVENYDGKEGVKHIKFRK